MCLLCDTQFAKFLDDIKEKKKADCLGGRING